MNLQDRIVFRIRSLRNILWGLRGSQEFERVIAYQEELTTLEGLLEH